MRKHILGACLGCVTLTLGPAALAQFDWGGDCDSGDGTFQQQIAHYATVKVGDIPTGKEDVLIELESPQDVDIQLIDKATGTKVVHWPDGLLNGPNKACVTYKQVQYCYSGYNGEGGQKGHEKIEINGVTNTPLVMRAFGYQAGAATVKYSFQAPNTCAETGEGSFEQYVPYYETATVGDIEANLYNVEIELKAPGGKDVDVQIWDGDVAVVAWPDGLLSGSSQESTTYKGMKITYSGYNGKNGNKGHETIQITGRVTTVLTMKAFGYQAGTAVVDYAWGVGVGAMCGGIAGFMCPEGLTCKEMMPVADGAGVCHTETWCGSPETAAEDCGNLIKIPEAVWTCTPEFTCKAVPWQPLCGPGDPTKHYKGDPETCPVIKFTCEEGQQYFSDPCGCGCQDVQPPACEGDLPDSADFVTTDPQKCQVIKFMCEFPLVPFSDPGCGCGCGCPDVIDCEPGNGNDCSDLESLQALCPNAQFGM